MYGLVSIGEVHWSFGAGMVEVPGDLVFISKFFSYTADGGTMGPVFWVA